MTYQSGVGLTSSAQPVEVTNETLTLLTKTVTEEQFKSYKGNLSTDLIGNDTPSDMNRLQFNQLNVAFAVIDLETTGLE